MKILLPAAMLLFVVLSAAAAMFPENVDPDVVLGDINNTRAKARAERELADDARAEAAAALPAAEGEPAGTAAEVASPEAGGSALYGGWIAALFGLAAAGAYSLHSMSSRQAPESGAMHLGPGNR